MQIKKKSMFIALGIIIVLLGLTFATVEIIAPNRKYKDYYTYYDMEFNNDLREHIYFVNEKTFKIFHKNYFKTTVITKIELNEPLVLYMKTSDISKPYKKIGTIKVVYNINTINYVKVDEILYFKLKPNEIKKG